MAVFNRSDARRVARRAKVALLAKESPYAAERAVARARLVEMDAVKPRESQGNANTAQGTQGTWDTESIADQITFSKEALDEILKWTNMTMPNFRCEMSFTPPSGPWTYRKQPGT